MFKTLKTKIVFITLFYLPQRIYICISRLIQGFSRPQIRFWCEFVFLDLPRSMKFPLNIKIHIFLNTWYIPQFSFKSLNTLQLPFKYVIKASYNILEKYIKICSSYSNFCCEPFFLPDGV